MKIFIKKLMKEGLKMRWANATFLLLMVCSLLMGCNGQKKAA